MLLFRRLRHALALSLVGLPALAQQPTPAPTPPPVLSPAPQAPPQPQPAAAPAPVPAAVAAPAPAPKDSEIIGQTYNVELASGTAFVGVLVASGAEELSFQTNDLGLLTIKRASIKQLTLLTPEQARRGFDYQGNGSRLFFAPTARNLRRGEGTIQTINIFLLGVNYGISDNFSLGALFTWIPEAGTDNLFALTPKVSFPVGERVRAGAGALVVFVGGENLTLAYGNATYGSADNNLTAGVGYAFVPGESGSQPVFLLGGIRRISRRFSLLNESYIIRAVNNREKETLIGGLAGVRVAGQRLSGSLGLLYIYSHYTEPNYSGGTYRSSSFNALPSVEATFRFGRGR